MEVTCRYKKKSFVNSPSPVSSILCALDIPISTNAALSAEEKKAIIKSISMYGHNVPAEYEETHNFISRLSHQLTHCKYRQATFTTQNGKYYVQLIISFKSMKAFENFVAENRLIAENF